MPSIRMRTSSAGPNGPRMAGKVYPVSAEEGAELVAGGFASWVEAPAFREKVVETATVAPAENAAVRVGAGRRRK